MATKIRFTAQGSNSLFGGFSSGDRATVGDALARHLVEEARVAEYAETAPADEKKPAASKPAAKNSRGSRDAGA